MIKAALAGSCPDCRRDGDRVHTRDAAGGDRGCQEAGSAELCRGAGLDPREDAVGNLFARWNGSDADLPAMASGSRPCHSFSPGIECTLNRSLILTDIYGALKWFVNRVLS
jgi:hypothetical protein